MPDNGEYVRGIQRKKAVYAASGIQCLFLEASYFPGYWPKRLLSELRGIQARRLEQLDGLRHAD